MLERLAPRALVEKMSPMVRRALLRPIALLAGAWAEWQEAAIVRSGVALSSDQMLDAKQIGILSPERVRLLAVKQIPSPLHPLLRWVGRKVGIIKESTIGLTVRYGILIRSDYWGDRRLLIHELAHTAQYERLGGFRPFLERYLRECTTPPGYPFGDLEQEAKRIEDQLCA
jgi:hypothetical protein